MSSALSRRSTELFRGFRPVFAQQPRQGAIGEELSASLTRWTIVSFVRGVANALHLAAAAGARFFVATMYCHAGAKCRYLFRKFVTRFFAQTFNPLHESRARRGMKTSDFRII